MPSSTATSKTPRASSANARISGRRSCIRAGSSSQPSHCASSEPVQSEASRAQIRSTSSAASTDYVATSSPDFARMPSRSSANESANFSTPSRSRVAVTSS